MNVAASQMNKLSTPLIQQPVRLSGLGTAVPLHALPQDQVLENARRILGPKYKDFGRLIPTFETSGVKQRYSVVPLNWFEEPQDWPSRTQAYKRGATALFCNAAQSALKDARLDASDIDTVVTVSSTGVLTPTIEACTMQTMGFRADVMRVPVFGLGCAGGVSGLSIATRLARANPGSNVLLVAVETCTLSFRSDRIQKSDIIATVLFGDGAAAAVLSSGGDDGPTLGEGHEHLWPDTLDIMGWDVDSDGFGVVFDRSIPNFVKENIAPALEGAASHSNLSLDAIDRFVCHPGGAKVVEAIEEAMSLPSGVLDHERTVLRDYGNMSAPTVLFVLDRIRKAAPRGQMMLAALGPGFTLSTIPVAF